MNASCISDCRFSHLGNVLFCALRSRTVLAFSRPLVSEATGLPTEPSQPKQHSEVCQNEADPPGKLDWINAGVDLQHCEFEGPLRCVVPRNSLGKFLAVFGIAWWGSSQATG